jgi:hypothetical protein
MSEAIAGAERDESFRSIVYISTATRGLNSEELEELLDVSRRNNQRDGITGMLLYVEGNFMQAIEGAHDRMRDLYQRLERDPRHRDVTKLVDEPLAHRQFAQWSMALRQVSLASIRKLEGFSDFLERGFDTEAMRAWPDKAHKLLLTFREVTLACN